MRHKGILIVVSGFSGAGKGTLMKKLLEKKNYRAESADYLERRKLKAFLYRKGFSLDNIEKIL